MLRHIQRERDNWQRVKFLATASARAAGHDVNYLEDEGEAQGDPALLAAWLQARAKPNGESGNQS